MAQSGALKVIAKVGSRAGVAQFIASAAGGGSAAAVNSGMYERIGAISISLQLIAGQLSKGPSSALGRAMHFSSATNGARLQAKMGRMGGNPFVLAKSCMRDAAGKKRGEDACFIANESANYLVAGIADGVGGWSQQGIDAGEYSRELMSHAHKQATNERMRKEPKRLLGEAHNKMSKDTQGSCTACIVVFEDNKLRYANLGDSGLLGYRDGLSSPFVRSKEQQHHFNCPYQLGSEHGDKAEAAKCEEVQVQQRDIIIMGTDGFFDNLFDDDIIKFIREFVSNRERKRNWPQTMEGKAAAAAAAATTPPSSSSAFATNAPDAQHARAMHTQAQQLAASMAPPAPAGRPASPQPNSNSSSNSAAPPSSSSSPFCLSGDDLQLLADDLVILARKVAEDKSVARTPFSVNAQQHGKKFRGGKMDDITVVVAQVQHLCEEDTEQTATQQQAS